MIISLRLSLATCVVSACALVGSMPVLAQTADEKVKTFNKLIADHDKLRGNINEKCAGEWPTDFSMQKYCREQQLEGYNDLKKIWDVAIRNIRSAAGQCVLDWSDDLLFDWQMIHYCTDQQLTAWRSLR